MKFTSILASLASLAVASASTSVILPLYIYPGDSDSAWNPVFSAVGNYPSVNFLIIVNPNSGPGSSQYPDSNYISGVAKLNTYPNVVIVGYVDTAYGNKAVSDVESEINTYAGWASYPSANIAVDGIFFDDVKATNGLYSYYSTVSSYAKQKVSSGHVPVVLNPGTSTSNAKWYSICDQFIVFECTYGVSQYCPNGYQGQTTISQTTLPGYVSQASIIVTDYTGSTSQLQSYIQNAVQDGLGAIYFDSDDQYASLSLLPSIAADIKAA